MPHAFGSKLYIATLIYKHSQVNMHIFPAAHMVLHNMYNFIHYTAKTGGISVSVPWHNMLSDHQ